MSLRADIERILRIVNVGDADVDRLVHDEHVRYQMYVDALSLASPSEERELISTVLRDPDSIMSEAAVVAHVDRRASILHSRSSFHAWTELLVESASRYSFIIRRINEWEIFKEIMDGGTGSVESLRDASDWLQRKLSQEATSRAALETLAEIGRTKRVRNMAESRARTLRR